MENDFNNKRDILCIYAAYNIDDYDFEFIRNNMDDCAFVIIDSLNIPYRNGTRLKHMEGIMYKTRPNFGYDVTAWKEFMLDNYDMVKSYDYVVLANNSCRYDFKIINAIHDMRSKGATFYGLNISPVHNDHVQSYFIILDKSIVDSRAFYNHWLYMKPIDDRDDAIRYHELTFMNDMKSAGAKVATLTTYDHIGSGYEPEYYHIGMGRIPPFFKKKLMNIGTMRSLYEQLLSMLPRML